MRFNSAPASVLYVKLYAKERPYSKEFLHFSLIASDVSVFKANKALYTMVVPDEVETDAELLRIYINKLCARYNYAEFVLVSE